MVPAAESALAAWGVAVDARGDFGRNAVIVASC